MTFPELYELMIAFRGDYTRGCVLKINQTLNRITYRSTYATSRIFTEMKSLLRCHVFGFILAGGNLSELTGEELSEWDDCFQCLLESLLYVSHPYHVKMLTSPC